MKVKQYSKSITSVRYMKIHLGLLIGLVFGIFLMSCDGMQIVPIEPTTSDVVKLVKGTYQGSISNTGSGDVTNDAIIDVSVVNDSTVMIVCTSTLFTDSVEVNLYPDGIYTQMCFTQQDFQLYYGYPMPNNNYCNNGSWNNPNNMNNQGHGNNGTVMSLWMNHLTNVHKVNDEHYGQFNMSNDSLNYTFQSITVTDTTLYVCRMQKTNR